MSFANSILVSSRGSTRAFRHSSILAQSHLPRSRSQISYALSSRVQRRAFSSADFVDVIVQVPYEIATNVHSLTGTSWALSIPISAIIIRIAMTPIMMKARSFAQRLTQHRAMLQANRSILERNERSRHQATLRRKYTPGKQEKTTEWRLKNLSRYYERVLKTQKWKNLMPLLQLPVYVVALEGIRRMVGMEGLLSYLTRRTSEVQKGALVSKEFASTSAASFAEATSPFDASMHATASTPVMSEATLNSIDTANIVSEAMSNHRLTDLFTPELANDSMLWIPSLLESDPELILPGIFAGLMITNVCVNFKRISPEEMTFLGPKARRAAVQNNVFFYGLFTLGLAAYPLLLEAPAGLLLYMCSSAGFALVQRWHLKRKMPIVIPAPPKQFAVRAKKGAKAETYADRSVHRPLPIRTGGIPIERD